MQQDESSASLVSVLWEAWDCLNKEMVKSWLFWWEMEIVGVNSFWVMLAAIDLVSCRAVNKLMIVKRKKGNFDLIEYWAHHDSGLRSGYIATGPIL